MVLCLIMPIVRESGKEKEERRVVLLVAPIASFLTPFMASAINVALPAIGKEFSMEAALLSWVVTAYLLSLAIFLVPLGKLADIYGRKKFFLFGVMIYTTACFFAAISPSATMLIGVRLIQGFGGSMLLGMGVAILISVFPASERGRVLGINVAAVYTGLSLGPFVGGILTQHFGWRSIFLLNVPIGAILFIFVSRSLQREWAEARGERFDFFGALIYALMLISIMLGFSLFPGSAGICLILLGVFGFLGFIRRELNLKDPLLDINLFRKNPVFAFSNLAALINYGATYAVGFLISLYLQYIQGISPKTAGLILVSQPVVQAIFSPFAGRLSDKIEPFIVASGGMLLTAAGLFLFSLLNWHTALSFILTTLVILGLGFALFSSPNTNAIVTSVEKRFYGVAIATLGTMRLIGQMLSMGIATMIFTLYMGKTKITPDSYALLLKGTKIAFAIFTVVCILGIFLSFVRGKVRKALP